MLHFHFQKNSKHGLWSRIYTSGQKVCPRYSFGGLRSWGLVVGEGLRCRASWRRAAGSRWEFESSLILAEPPCRVSVTSQFFFLWNSFGETTGTWAGVGGRESLSLSLWLKTYERTLERTSTKMTPIQAGKRKNHHGRLLAVKMCRRTFEVQFHFETIPFWRQTWSETFPKLHSISLSLFSVSWQGVGQGLKDGIPKLMMALSRLLVLTSWLNPELLMFRRVLLNILYIYHTIFWSQGIWCRNYNLLPTIHKSSTSSAKLRLSSSRLQISLTELPVKKEFILHHQFWSLPALNITSFGPKDLFWKVPGTSNLTDNPFAYHIYVSFKEN